MKSPLHIILALGVVTAAGAQTTPSLKTENFDRDPGWEGRNNRIMPKNVPMVTQHFGHSATHFAGKAAGELGGIVTRATVPAFYAARIAPKTLNEQLTATGTFAITSSEPSSSLFFGWFNSKQPGGSRSINSLGMEFGGEGTGLRLLARAITGTNKTFGIRITPFIPGILRPAPIKNDGTRYTWSMSYDPGANDGKGAFQFTIKSNSDKPQDFEGKVFTGDLPDGFKQEGIVFDRFGLMNMGKPGGKVTAYYDDLQFDGRSEDFSKDPDWEGVGNLATYQAEEVVGAHDYGYSAASRFAGGGTGEIGGIVWRTEKNFGYYADRVGPLTLNDRLEARGKVILTVGGPDSAAYLGWFSSEAKELPASDAGNFVGIRIEGPTRVGHYFLPGYTTAKASRSGPSSGPVLTPFKTHEWTLLYDPAADNGRGAMQVTLDGETVTHPLKPGHKQEGARFDRFGILSARPGGSMVKIFFDDLTYTIAAPQ
jgi:hypothetical protein